MHSYNGDIDTAFYYIERGFAIGFNAIVTFSPDYHDLIRAIPVGNIVVETDAPYLAPAPYRGKRNEPRYVLEVLAQIAAIRKEKESEFMSKVLANSMEYI